jgi:hypothetical protein
LSVASMRLVSAQGKQLVAARGATATVVWVC